MCCAHTNAVPLLVVVIQVVVVCVPGGQGAKVHRLQSFDHFFRGGRNKVVLGIYHVVVPGTSKYVLIVRVGCIFLFGPSLSMNTSK